MKIKYTNNSEMFWQAILKQHIRQVIDELRRFYSEHVQL